MTPGSQPRKKRNSSKVNLTISLVFHGLIVAALVYFAAREGLLGKELKKLAVTMVKEKPPEKPKEPEKPKVEPPKTEPPKVAIAPKIEPPKQVAAPPGNVAAPPVTAPPVDIPSFFGGGVDVKTDSDPVHIYQGQIESILWSRWNRPEDMDDAKFVAEVELTISPDGELSNPVWKMNSGNKKWDDSVRQAIAGAKSLPTAPPAKFPSHFTVRFDVDSQKTEPIMQ